MNEELKKWFDQFDATKHSDVRRWTLRITNSILNNLEDANDAVQDVLLEAHQHSSKLEESFGTINAWVFKVARNKALDQLQKRNRRQCTLISTIEEESVTEELCGCYDTLPEVEVEKAELYKALDVARGQLPTDDANLIRLHYEDRLSYAEIGKKLRKPMNTVKSKIRRSIIKLRIMLHASGFDETI